MTVISSSSRTSNTVTQPENAPSVARLRGGLLAALMTSTALVGMVLQPAQAQRLEVDGDQQTIDTPRTFSNVSVGDAQPNSQLDIVSGGALTITGDLSVALDDEDGLVTISGGGTASANRLYLGGELGTGTGTLTISGSGSKLSVAGNANIGFDDGSGIITLSDGGVLELGNGLRIAPVSGSTGTLNIGAAAGQTAAAAGHVRGTGGAATAIEFGTFSTGDGKIVFNHIDTDLDFNANVTGTGNIEVFSGTTILSGTNDIGDGAIIVEGGELKITGTTKADDLDVGKNPGSNGTVTISGSGSTLTVADKTYIGRSGNGTLNITNGGEAVFTGGPYLATGAGTTGTITISGAGSKLTSAGLMTVGDVGTGVLAISDGGTATVRSMSVGTFEETAQGTVTVSGAGSELTVFGATSKLDVGSTGSGTLSISEGGNVAVAASTFVGRNPSGSGTVTIAGNGSKLTSGEDIDVGHFGSGTLTITGGGEAAASKNVVLGNFSGSSGTVTVSGSGSKLTAGENITVGNQGAATLTVSDGGAVDAGTNVIIGNASQGTATVTGSGSRLTAAENLIVGNLDDGTLTILAGGAAEAVNNVNIALNFGSTSTATVSGAGSKLAAGSSFKVGTGGAGTLNVTNGGYVDTGNVLSVGTDSTASGTVTISGAGSVVKNGFATYVGKGGQGTLTISDGGELQGADVIFFGFAAGSEGNGIVTGSGSKLSSQAVLIGRQGNGTLTISNGGVAEVTTGVTIARDAGTSGTLNIGAASGDAAVAAGTVRGTNGAAANISFGSGTGSLVFNHSETDYGFNATVSGNGTLSQEAGRTTLTGDFSGFAGTGAVSGGTLAVNTTFGQPVNVLSGGTLTGTGSVGTLDFATGSAYEFGFNGNGGLTSTGAITIAAGSNLAVEFGNPANASIWQPTTVLTGNTLTGTFGTSNTDDYLFLDVGVSYTATDVVVDVDRNNVTFASIASTPNQTAVAAAVNELANGNEVYDTFATLKSAADARDAFDQLSGEAHASTMSSLLMGSNTVRSLIDGRMRTPSNQAQAAGVQDMFLAYFPKAASPPASDDLPDWAGIFDTDIAATPTLDAWSQVYGDFGKLDGNANAAEQKSAGGGVLAGLETDNFYGFQAGVLLGYGHSETQVAGRNSQTDTNSFTIGAYGSREFGALRTQVGTTFSRYAIGSERQVALGGLSNTLTANYGAQTIQAFGELGYAFDLPLATLEPFAGFAVIQSNTDGFTESGGAAALKINGTAQTSGVSTLGVRINGQLGATGTASKLAYNGTLAWRHQFGAGTPSVTSSFASGGPGFTVTGVPIDQDTLVLEAGLTYSPSQTMDLSAAYGGEFGTSTQHHNLNARLSLKF